jgi:glycosyltransferase involved in cell wall biosynthesis
MADADSTGATAGMSRHRVDQHRALLLVTRNFPPMVGGLERYSEDLYRSLAEKIPVVLLANSRGLHGVPLFMVRVLWHVLWHRRVYQHVHFTDAALAPLGVLVRRLTGATVTVSTHALDVVYPNPLYQSVVVRALERVDGVVSVSRFTRDACVERGVDPGRCRVIPNGIRGGDPRAVGSATAGPDLHGLERKRVLLTIGRLVRRKGLAWFVDRVMPRLDDDHVLLVGGDGVERPAIERAVNEHGLADRVRLLGPVDEARKHALLARADLFVMPNRTVAGDAEGFGISVIEATAHGVPVIASGIEGLRDSVLDGVTGTLVPEGEVEAWLGAIRSARFDPEQVSGATLERFDWARLADDYLEFFATAAAAREAT